MKSSEWDANGKLSRVLQQQGQGQLTVAPGPRVVPTASAWNLPRRWEAALFGNCILLRASSMSLEAARWESSKVVSSGRPASRAAMRSHSSVMGMAVLKLQSAQNYHIY